VYWTLFGYFVMKNKNNYLGLLKLYELYDKDVEPSQPVFITVECDGYAPDR
jgi:hypothetical protein